ncbi:hypothetical protein ACFQ05_32565 [Amycolatopsis umgeniensis]|uniref:Uncharacterized protein n=1 Tax=Amycolatopsis umgeniensis TaxID=336628 RepID=A0A841AP23_9PSEU|nr:hypothetical protein [Amycolatopsis umgeniensis]MBB5850519.1 hypothetical protein [Amycolatopsis umgeniensis]
MTTGPRTARSVQMMYGLAGVFLIVAVVFLLLPERQESDDARERGSATASAPVSQQPARTVTSPPQVDVRQVRVEQLLIKARTCGAVADFRISKDEGALQVPAVDGDKFDITVQGDRVYGDVDKDGAEDLALKATCVISGGKVRAGDGYLIFLARGDVVEQVGFLEAQRRKNAQSKGVVEAISFERGIVMTTENNFRSYDALCCPSEISTIDWTYHDGRLIPQRVS